MSEMQKKQEVEFLLNKVTDLSAEAVVSIDEGEYSAAREQLTELQGYVDAFMEKNNMRQVTEGDSDFREYMNKVYVALDPKPSKDFYRK